MNEKLHAALAHQPTYYAGSKTPTCCIEHAIAATSEGPQPYAGLHRHDPADCQQCAALAASGLGEDEDWQWQCAGCHRPVPPMGMCETCGVFGIYRLSGDAVMEENHAD